MWSARALTSAATFRTLLRLPRLLLRDTLALLGLLQARVRLLAKLLRLLAPLRLLAVAPCPEDDEPEHDEHADRDQDPDPSCRFRLLVCSEASGRRAWFGSSLSAVFHFSTARSTHPAIGVC
jgi:hypothetical protein